MRFIATLALVLLAVCNVAWGQGLPGGFMPGVPIQSGGAAFIQFNNGFITNPSTALFHLGASDAASPVAQTLGVQGVVAGNANTAAANFTISGGLSNGSGGGDLILATTLSSAGSGTQNSAATALTLKGGTQAAIFAGTLSAALAQTTEANMLCYNSGTGLITYSTVAQQCTVSDENAKYDMQPIDTIRALSIVAASNPISYFYRHEMDLGTDRHIGFGAQTLARLAPELAVYDENGKPIAIKQAEIAPMAWAAIKALVARLEAVERKR